MSFFDPIRTGLRNLFEIKQGPEFSTDDTPDDELNESGIVSSPTGKKVNAIKADKETRLLAAALTQVFTRLHSNKEEYKKVLKDLETYYLVDAIFNQLAEDSLTPDITTGEVVGITSNNTQIKEALDTLQSTINFDQLVNDFILDLLQTGDYYLRIKAVKGKGVEAVNDDVDQDTLLALYDKGLPSKFLVKTPRQIKLVAPYHYCHFVLGKSKLRIKISDFMTKGATIDTDSYRIPNYVRVGRPVLYGVINKIKELLLLEKLIPASKINQLSSGNIVSVGLPAHTTPEKAFEVARQIEQILNQKIGVNKNSNELTVTDILSTAGRIKVIPAFGDKGAISNVDAKDSMKSVDDLTNSVKDLREVILSSVGIPPQLLFGGDSSKSDLLKRYARYLRRLKTIQTSIANGLIQIALIHLTNLDIEANPSDIKVEFRNEIVNIDELDKLEYHDAIIGMTDKIMATFNAMMQNPVIAETINIEEMANSVKSILDLSINLSRVIEPTKLAGKSLSDIKAKTPPEE